MENLGNEKFAKQLYYSLFGASPPTIQTNAKIGKIQNICCAPTIKRNLWTDV